MGKRKICFFSFRAYPLFNPKVNEIFGGAEIDLYLLAQEMAKNEQNSVTFVVGDYGQKYLEYFGNIRVIRYKFFNPEKYPAWPYKILRQLVLWKELLFLKCDIMLTEASSELLGWLGLISKGLKGGKLIFRLASDADADFWYTRSKSLKSYLLYKFGLFRSDLVISQTDRQRKLLKDNLNLDSIVLKNGFYLDFEAAIENKQYILWVGRAIHWKRPELFIELVKSLPQEKFLMIMPGDNPAFRDMKRKIKGLSNLTLIDYVPFRDIQRYYNEAKLFVNTSECEGFPNAFLQSCLGKTPILSFKINPDSFIDHHRLGICCNDDMEQAIAFIQGLSDESVRTYGENAFDYVRRNHNIVEIAGNYDQLISKLADN